MSDILHGKVVRYLGATTIEFSVASLGMDRKFVGEVSGDNYLPGDRIVVARVGGAKSEGFVVVGNLSRALITNPGGGGGGDGMDATLVRIDSSHGLLFKDNMIDTVLSVTIFRGSKMITDIDAMHAEYGPASYLEWQWKRYGEDVFSTIVASDPRIGNGGFSLALTAADVDTKVVFRCILNGDF